MLYGIVEADVTDSTMLTVGSSVMRQNFDGYNLFGLPRYSNGADIGLPRDFYLGGPDDRWLRNNTSHFVRIDQQLGSDWTFGVEASRAKSNNNRRDMSWASYIDPLTGTGPGTFRDRDFDYDETQDTLDAVLRGSFLGSGRIISQGVDVEVSGEIVDRWRVHAGYTFNDNQNQAEGGVYSTITPKHLFKLWTTYAFQGQLEGLKVGGGVTAQSSYYQRGFIRTFNNGVYDGPETPFDFTEPGRAVVDLLVQYDISKNWSLALNVNNIFDKKYYYVTESNPWAGNFYGTPRNFLFTARANF